MIKMPPRHSVADQIAIAAGKCLRSACERHFEFVPLSKVANVISGGTPSTAEPALWDGDIVWVTPKDLGRPRNIEIDSSERRITRAACESSSATLLPVGTVLLSSRAPIGHVGIAAVPLCTNQGFKNLICSKSLNNRFLFHLLRASIEDLQALGRGNTFKEIPAKVVKEFAIPLPPLDVQSLVARFLDQLYFRLEGNPAELPQLPAPLSEQRRIVARIEELATKIEEARDLRRQTANEAEALLSSGLRHLLMPTDGWQLKPISDCSTMSTGTTPPSHMEDYYQGDLQWYTPGDLKFSKTLGRSSRTVSDRAVAEGKVRVFEPGTVLLVAIGASLGKVGLAYDRCSSNQQITGVKFSSDILPEYGFWWMRRLYSDLRAAAPQATLPIINQRRIGQFEIAIPPLRQQWRIVAHLDDLQTKVDALKRLQDETAAELDAMLPSILDKAFKGEL